MFLMSLKHIGLILILNNINMNVIKFIITLFYNMKSVFSS